MATVFVKGTFVVRKWRSRSFTGPGRQRQLSNVAGIQIGSRLQEGMASSSQQLEKALALNAMFLDNKMERWQQYCALLTAVFEDIPMGTGFCHVCIAPTGDDGPPVTMVQSIRFVSGTMNTYYLFKTTVECVDATAEADATKRTCDLNSFATLVLLLSMQPLVA